MVAGQRRAALATMLVMMMTPRVESDAGADSSWAETLNAMLVMLVMMAARQRRAVRSVEDDTATDDGWAERRSVEGNAGDAGGWAESRSVSKLKTTLNAGNHHDDALSVGSVKTMLVMMLAASGRPGRRALKAMLVMLVDGLSRAALVS